MTIQGSLGNLMKTNKGLFSQEMSIKGGEYTWFKDNKDQVYSDVDSQSSLIKDKQN